MLKGTTSTPPIIPLSTQFSSHCLGEIVGELIHKWYKHVEIMELMEEV